MRAPDEANINACAKICQATKLQVANYTFNARGKCEGKNFGGLRHEIEATVDKENICGVGFAASVVRF